MPEDRWSSELREALAADDGDRLAALFDEAVRTWGRDEASRRWWLVLSAYDAGAVTG